MTAGRPETEVCRQEFSSEKCEWIVCAADSGMAEEIVTCGNWIETVFKETGTDCSMRQLNGGGEYG